MKWISLECEAVYKVSLVGFPYAVLGMENRKLNCLYQTTTAVISGMKKRIIPGPKVIKLFSCSTQLKFFLLINVKMPTIVGILTFMSGQNSIQGLSEPKKKLNFLIFLYLSAFKISCSTGLSLKKVLEPRGLERYAK